LIALGKRAWRFPIIGADLSLNRHQLFSAFTLHGRDEAVCDLQLVQVSNSTTMPQCPPARPLMPYTKCLTWLVGCQQGARVAADRYSQLTLRQPGRLNNMRPKTLMPWD
jgi:hypothetical protein